GASTTCTGSYTILAADVTSGSVVNTATASGVTESGTPVTSNQDSETVSTTPESAALTLDKTVSSITDVNANGLNDAGDIINYTFTVTAAAANNVDISGVVINDSKVTATCLATTL